MVADEKAQAEASRQAAASGREQALKDADGAAERRSDASDQEPVAVIERRRCLGALSYNESDSKPASSVGGGRIPLRAICSGKKVTPRKKGGPRESDR